MPDFQARLEVYHCKLWALPRLKHSKVFSCTVTESSLLHGRSQWCSPSQQRGAVDVLLLCMLVAIYWKTKEWLFRLHTETFSYQLIAIRATGSKFTANFLVEMLIWHLILDCFSLLDNCPNSHPGKILMPCADFFRVRINSCSSHCEQVKRTWCTTPKKKKLPTICKMCSLVLLSLKWLQCSKHHRKKIVACYA